MWAEKSVCFDDGWLLFIRRNVLFSGHHNEGEFADINSLGSLTSIQSTRGGKIFKQEIRPLYYTFTTHERQFPHKLPKSALLRSAWGIWYWACMCTVNYSCAWSRWMSLSAFYLQRKGVIKHWVVVCDEMKCLCAPQSAVALRDPGLLVAWMAQTKHKSVWLGKHFNHLQKPYFSIFKLALWHHVMGSNTEVWTGHCKHTIWKVQCWFCQVTISTSLIYGLWCYPKLI